jgi:hypothetical protein
MIELDEQQHAARTWFQALRNRNCVVFEASSPKPHPTPPLPRPKATEAIPDGKPGQRRHPGPVSLTVVAYCLW